MARLVRDTKWLLLLFRWPNLLIVAGLQWVIWWKFYSGSPAGIPASIFSFPQFFLLCGTTCLIAAAGYIINDFYDRESDSINNPAGMIAYRKMRGSRIQGLYGFLVAVSILTTSVLAVQHDRWWYLSVAITAHVLLWVYSALFQHVLLLGNVLVSVFCSLVIVAFLAVDGRYLQAGLTNGIPNDRILAGFALFAFLSTLMREIAKDAQDRDGDRVAGTHSFPLRYGMRSTGRLLSWMSLLLFASLLTFLLVLLRPVWDGKAIGLSVLIILPGIPWFLSLQGPPTSRQFGKSSMYMKCWMAASIVFLLLL